MSTGRSVTHWIGQIKAGEEWALEKLRQRYWPFLVGLAGKKLTGVRRTAADEEDVAQEAFWGFYRGFKAGRLPSLENRNQLLALLTIITTRKAATLIEREKRAKRGGGHLQGESALGSLAGSTARGRPIEHIERVREWPAATPSPLSRWGRFPIFTGVRLSRTGRPRGDYPTSGSHPAGLHRTTEIHQAQHPQTLQMLAAETVVVARPLPLVPHAA